MSDSLLAAITAETSALQHFIAILEEEQKLLIGGDADAVLPLIDKKTGLIAELGNAGQQREAALREIGVEIRKEAMEAWFAKAPPVLQQRWQQLLELAQTANRLNNTNGQLINTRLQYNQQALSILINAGDSVRDDTYGPDGHKSTGSGSRPLGSA